MLRQFAFVITAGLLLGTIFTSAASARSHQDATSKTNQGKGTAEMANPKTSTPQEVMEGSLNLDRDLSAVDGQFDEINQPQQAVRTNKGKGTRGLASHYVGHRR